MGYLLSLQSTTYPDTCAHSAVFLLVLSDLYIYTKIRLVDVEPSCPGIL